MNYNNRNTGACKSETGDREEMKAIQKIAYLVIAYMDPEQLKRLTERLVKDSDVYIHINSSVDIRPFQEHLAAVKGEGRAAFSRERFRIVWGGYSILKATFSMLEQAFAYKEYDRVVLLTGLDYPIKSNREIQQFFQEHADVEFVHGDTVTGEMYEHLYYYDCRDSRVLHKLFELSKNILKKCGIREKKDYVMHQGQRYRLYGITPKWALSGKGARYLLDFYHQNKRFNQYFQLMHAPDDFYVATVLLNSEFKERVETKKDIFKIIWLPEDRGAKVLSEEDEEELLQCQELYAKKFQSDTSVRLQDRLEAVFQRKQEENL